jgi:hypothetical protein
VIEGKIHDDKLKVAFAENTAKLGPVNGFFASITSTFIAMKEGSGPSPTAFCMLMPPIGVSLSGITRFGEFENEKV